MAGFRRMVKEVLRAALTRDTFSIEAYENRKTAIARGVVRRFARGNVSIQNGFFVTAEDLERERAALANWHPLGRTARR